MSACPVCTKPAAADSHPFCSKRCCEVDLNRWFTGGYAVPAIELDDVADEDLAALMDPEG